MNDRNKIVIKEVKLNKVNYIGLLIGMLVVCIESPHAVIPTVIFEVALLSAISEIGLHYLAVLAVLIVQITIILFGRSDLTPRLHRIILSSAIFIYALTLLGLGIATISDEEARPGFLVLITSSLFFAFSISSWVNILMLKSVKK